MPMMTASGPISEDDGVLLPLETWWRGEAESSSLLITDDGPDRERVRGGMGEFSMFTSISKVTENEQRLQEPESQFSSRIV